MLPAFPLFFISIDLPFIDLLPFSLPIPPLLELGFVMPALPFFFCFDLLCDLELPCGTWDGCCDGVNDGGSER